MTDIKSKISTDSSGVQKVLNYEGQWFKYLDKKGKIIQLDLDGVVIKRPKIEYPYSYSSFCIFNIDKEKLNQINEQNQKIITVHTDRIISANPEKYNKISMIVFGDKSQNFDTRCPNKIELFLQTLYSDTTIQLIKIIESCNASSGYPSWSFSFSKNN